MIFFRGNITNHDTLCALHEIPGNFSTEDLILKLYKKYDDQVVHHLRGDFALAINDMDNDKILLVRDRLGVRSLYYSIKNGHVYYDEFIKEVVKAISPQPLVNPEALYSYLTFLALPEDMTFYKGIWKLEPGTYVVIQKGCVIKKEKYWDAAYYLNNPIQDSCMDAMNYIDNTMRNIVSRYEEPYCIALSGGVDSSLLAVYSDVMNRNFISISAVINGDYGCEELRRIEEISKYRGNISNKIISISIDDIVVPEILKSLTRLIMEPINLLDSVIILGLLQTITEEVDLCLFGEGADELGGYPEYYALNELWELICARKKTNYLNMYNGYYIPKRNMVGLTSDEVAMVWKGERRFDCRDYIANIYREVLVDKEDAFLRRVQNVDIKFRLPEYLLRRTNTIGASLGIKTAFPFVDERITEYCLRLDKSNMVQNGEAKKIFKELVYQYIPSELWKKTKIGLGDELGSHAENIILKKYFQEIANNIKHPIRNFVDINKANEVVKRNRKAAWIFYSLSIWIELYYC